MKRIAPKPVPRAPARAPRARALTVAWLRAHPLPDPFATSDKEERGRVLVLGGSADVPGAVLLAGTAALHAGAGKLHIATARPVARQLAIGLPEAMVSPVPIDARGELASLPASIRAAAAETDALLLGPGMAPGRAANALVPKLLRKTSATACVIDAGAIGKGLRALPKGATAIVTPHAGEMAAATGLDRTDIEADPARVALAFASDYRCIVVMKGVPTHIATPAGELLRFSVRAPGLGTSGSGDVLAGLIAGLLARGTAALPAAAWGVWLHGRAGLALGESMGPVGYLARDLSPRVPALMQRACGGVAARSRSQQSRG